MAVYKKSFAMDHIPVFGKEITDSFKYLSGLSAPVFVDGTLGAAGHSVAIARELKVKPCLPAIDSEVAQARGAGMSTKLKIIGVDKDESALEIARQNIKKAGLSDHFELIHADFKEFDEILHDLEIPKVDGILLDLGVSSMQLDQENRGFSFRSANELLDMRMDRAQKLTAAEVVNSYPQKKLEEIISQFGEERHARSITRNIVLARKDRELSTIGQLVEIIGNSIPSRLKHSGKIHFATKTFQAIRIEVNHELEGLDLALEKMVSRLSMKGKLAVITFHSLEDRIVKQTFNLLANPCTCPKDMPCICGKKPLVQILTKKPMKPSAAEISGNPRARSAKLRIVQKI